MRHVVGQCDPAGVHIARFGRPTAEEREHDFLWRVRRQLPRPGKVGVFDRSHYEDVLAVRVRGRRRRAHVARRYDAINRFEAELAAGGTQIVKCFLHISPEEQRERLLARLDDPTKHWKYNPRRPRGPRAVGRVHGRLRRRARALQHRGGAVARRPRRSQVVPQLGDHAAAVEQLEELGAALAGARRSTSPKSCSRLQNIP